MSRTSLIAADLASARRDRDSWTVSLREKIDTTTIVMVSVIISRNPKDTRHWLIRARCLTVHLDSRSATHTGF